jgi:hypothetical protein
MVDQTDTTYTAYVSGIAGDTGSGLMSVAFLLIGPDGTEITREFHDYNTWGSPHDAEYKALLHLIDSLKDRPEIKNLSILSSNNMIVNQMTGKWRINVDRHREYYVEVNTGFSRRFKIGGIGLSYVPKAENRVKEWHWERHAEVRQSN